MDGILRPGIATRHGFSGQELNESATNDLHRRTLTLYHDRWPNPESLRERESATGMRYIAHIQRFISSGKASIRGKMAHIRPVEMENRPSYIEIRVLLGAV